VGVEIGTSMVVRAAATVGGVGAGAGAYQASQDARARDNEPTDSGLARMQGQAAVMVANSGIAPKTNAVDFTAPRGS
jgi:hypothetical protein